jgi:hypothetical protein
MVGYAEAIGSGFGQSCYGSFEQTSLMEACHGNGLSSSFTEEEGNVVGFGQETANRNGRGTTLNYRMSAKNCARVPVVTLDELFELIERHV